MGARPTVSRTYFLGVFMVKTTTNRHQKLEKKSPNARGQNAVSTTPDKGILGSIRCSEKQHEQDCFESANNVDLKGKCPSITEHYFPFKIEAIYGFKDQKATSVSLDESDNNPRPQADLCFARLLGKQDHKKAEFTFKKNTDRDKILVLNRTAPCLPGKWVAFGCQGGLWLERIIAISTDSITFASDPQDEIPADQVEMIGVVAKVQHAWF